MSTPVGERLKQDLANRTLLREPLEPALDGWDETYRLSDWPPGEHAEGEQAHYKHHHHSEPARFDLPMSAH